MWIIIIVSKVVSFYNLFQYIPFLWYSIFFYYRHFFSFRTGAMFKRLCSSYVLAGLDKQGASLFLGNPAAFTAGSFFCCFHNMWKEVQWIRGTTSLLDLVPNRAETFIFNLFHAYMRFTDGHWHAVNSYIRDTKWSMGVHCFCSKSSNWQAREQEWEMSFIEGLKKDTTFNPRLIKKLIWVVLPIS